MFILFLNKMISEIYELKIKHKQNIVFFFLLLF